MGKSLPIIGFRDAYVIVKLQEGQMFWMICWQVRSHNSDSIAVFPFPGMNPHSCSWSGITLDSCSKQISGSTGNVTVGGHTGLVAIVMHKLGANETRFIVCTSSALYENQYIHLWVICLELLESVRKIVPNGSCCHCISPFDRKEQLDF